MAYSFVLENGNPFPAAKQRAARTRDIFARFWYNRLWQQFISRYELADYPDSVNPDFTLWTLARAGYILGGRDDADNVRLYPGTFTNPDTYGFPRSISLIPYHPTGEDPALFTRTVGVDGAFIRFTPNALGVCDLISEYSTQLAQIDIDINVNLENCKLSRVFVANSGDQAQKIRRLVDDVTKGELAVIVDDDLAALMFNQNTGKVPVFSTPAEYLVDKLIQDRRQVINDFLTAIGVDNNGANLIKAERNLTAEVSANDEEVARNASYWIDTVAADFDKMNRVLNTNIKIRYKTVQNEPEEVLTDDREESADE